MGCAAGSVGRAVPARNFRRAARGRGSVGRPVPGRDRPFWQAWVGRSVTFSEQSTSRRPYTVRLIYYGLRAPTTNEQRVYVSDILDDTDCNGTTALHLAARHGTFIHLLFLSIEFK